MRKITYIALAMAVLLLAPVASAQYRDLDSALQSLARGFERGDAQPILEGVSGGDKVMLEFPGLLDQSGFFGRDQASYLLDELFNKARPAGFETVTAQKKSAEGQYHIEATWSVQTGGQKRDRDLYITLRNKDDRWSLVSVRSPNR
jgi:hypothetical protein